MHSLSVFELAFWGMLPIVDALSCSSLVQSWSISHATMNSWGCDVTIVLPGSLRIRFQENEWLPLCPKVHDLYDVFWPLTSHHLIVGGKPTENGTAAWRVSHIMWMATKDEQATCSDFLCGPRVSGWCNAAKSIGAWCPSLWWHVFEKVLLVFTSIVCVRCKICAGWWILLTGKRPLFRLRRRPKQTRAKTRRNRTAVLQEPQKKTWLAIPGWFMQYSLWRM